MSTLSSSIRMFRDNSYRNDSLRIGIGGARERRTRIVQIEHAIRIEKAGAILELTKRSADSMRNRGRGLSFYCRSGRREILVRRKFK